METYDRIEYKIKEKIEICKKEEVLVNGLDFEQKRKEEIEKNKEVLIITECDVPDYGTKEIKGKIIQAKGVELAKQDDLTKRIIANIKQMEVYSKMEVDINIDNKTEIVGKTNNELDKVEDISSSIWAQVSKSSQSTVSCKREGKLGLTLWNIPTYTRAIHIKKALSFYEKVLIHEVMAAGKSKALYIELKPKGDRKASFLQLVWAVYFEKSKMLKLTQGKFDKETLVERSKLKAILKNVPKSIIESSLLQQLKLYKAKAAYVSHNSNGNQRGMASVYFESKKDLDNTLSSTVWYYNTKLEWINGRGFLNQGMQEAKVYTEARNNKKPKSAEENNFGRKKGKEKFIMSNRSQGNHIHKFVDQKSNTSESLLMDTLVVIKKAAAPLAVVDAAHSRELRKKSINRNITI
ncbi:30911_t:CDS:2, partial [Gigaspora margarita]